MANNKSPAYYIGYTVGRILFWCTVILLANKLGKKIIPNRGEKFPPHSNKGGK